MEQFLLILYSKSKFHQKKKLRRKFYKQKETSGEKSGVLFQGFLNLRKMFSFSTNGDLFFFQVWKKLCIEHRDIPFTRAEKIWPENLSNYNNRAAFGISYLATRYIVRLLLPKSVSNCCC